MVSSNGEYLEAFEAAVLAWEDERFISRKELRAVSMFYQYLVNLSEADGWRYDGQSFKMGSPMCCLVVKATIEGTPYVVFTSARTPMGCVVIFMRKLEEGLLEWREDRFRQ